MNNYSETVIIPFFQKKISELQSLVTVLEANYLVEQQKAKELSEKLSETISGQQSASKESESMISQIRSELNKKANEASQLTETNALIAKRIEDLKRVIQQQDQTIIALDARNKELENSLNSTVKRRKQKEVVLDGSTF